MKKLLVFLIVLLSFGSSHAGLVVDIDGASFKYDSSKSIYEFYYSLPDSTVKYKSNNGKFEAEVMFSLSFRKIDTVIQKIEWIITYSKDSYNDKGKNLLGQKTLLLEPGYYYLDINIKDLNDTANALKSEITIFVKDFNDEKLLISDIELAQIIESATKSSRVWNESYKKNTLYVIPNPSLEIIGTSPAIKLYAEIYNAKRYSPDGITIEYRIIDPARNEVLFYPKKRISLNDGLIETIEMPIDAVPSGVYNLQLTVKGKNKDRADTSITNKKIYVLNPEMPPVPQVNFVENQEFEKSEFATMEETQVNYEYARSSYIASNYEKDLFKKCSTPEAKRHFMYSFWRKRNMDTTSPVNRAREEYLSLQAHADKFFSYGKNNDGWKTDRGKIYMKYGAPTQIDQKTLEGDKRAHDTWFYAEYQGGAYFYFVDMSGNGNYVFSGTTCCIYRVRNRAVIQVGARAPAIGIACVPCW